MSLLVRNRPTERGTVAEAVNGRGRRRAGANGTVTDAQAMRLSVAWACRRLRSDMVSTMPIDTFRRAGGVQLETPKPPVMVTPGGATELDFGEFLAATQLDLDGHGNTFGVVEERDSSPQRRPVTISLQPAATATVRRVKDRWHYTLGGKEYDQKDVWHERQFVVSGSPLGLSPIAHAALTLATSLTAAEFANTWFGQGARPGAHLRNTGRTLDKAEARGMKRSFKANMEDGDVFVSGSDWEYKVISGTASESMFLDQINASNVDVCRYLGTPADMVDVAVASGSITYANITQRNLQFLILNLNPALIRRENRFTRDLLPAPRYAKFNRGALQQMDLKTRYEAHKLAIEARFETPDEARALEELPPLTPEQEAQFARLFGNKNGTPQQTPTPAPGGTP